MKKNLKGGGGGRDRNEKIFVLDFFHFLFVKKIADILN
jgi:hypothetical protein